MNFQLLRCVMVSLLSVLRIAEAASKHQCCIQYVDCMNFFCCTADESSLCQQSMYTNYPQAIYYGIEGEQLCINCKHSILNNATFMRKGQHLICGGSVNTNCSMDSIQATLCFNSVSANDLNVTYGCVHQVSFTGFCTAGFIISRGGA